MTRVFISGHLDLTREEFEMHYRPLIDHFLTLPDTTFIVGDARGADTLVQEYLATKAASVTVYHMFSSPRNNAGGFKTNGGFSSDEARDTQMTQDSDVDLAWVRPGREKSGTQKNLQRRQAMSRNSDL